MKTTRIASLCCASSVSFQRTLPAFAAERRRLHHGARSGRSMSPARGALSSKPTGRRCFCRSIGQRRTDGRTDARSFNRPCTAYGSASKQRHRLTLTVTSDFTTASRKEHTRCSSTVINHCPAVEWLLAAFKRHYALRLAIAPEFFYCSYMCLMFALGC